MAKKRTGGKRLVRDRDGIATPDRLPSGSWRYRVWAPLAERYETRSFKEDAIKDAGRRLPGCAAGDEWAKNKQARLTTGLDSASANVDLAQVGHLYVSDRELRGRSGGHLQAIHRALKVAADAGVSDLTDNRVADRVLRHLAALNAQRPGQVTTPPVSARTRNSHIAILRAIGRFAMRRQLLVRNPFDHLERFIEASEHRRVYTIAELRRLVSDDARFPARRRAEAETLIAAHPGDVETAAKAGGWTPQQLTHCLKAKSGDEEVWWRFIVLCAYTGLRSETVRALRWSMIDWEASRLRIPGEVVKNKTAVRARIQPELASILREWYEQRSTETVLPLDQAQLTSDRANELTKAYLLRHGVIPNGRSVHCFRHTTAALLTATGTSTHLTMDLLGHTSTTTSKHYAFGADEFQDALRDERWPEGEFFFRRQPPRPTTQVGRH
ncbi:MAG: site-specific integrase [Acidobacteria bacterium]|nr:site-specific integrase [Acidobacteriota bacterium]